MTHEPIHYVPVSEQRYAEIIENLDQHPGRNQWSRQDRQALANAIDRLAISDQQEVAGDTMIPMAVDLVSEVADWLPTAVGFYPRDLTRLLMSYVQPQSERGS